MNLKSFVLHGYNEVPFALDLYSSSSDHSTCVIYVHGFNGFKDWGAFSLVAAEFVKADMDMVSFNFSHNGTSLNCPAEFVELERYGQNNYSIELDDLGKVIDFVNGLGCYRHIILLGHSRGGGISIIKAAEDNRVSALITWGSVSVCKTPWGAWSEQKIQGWKEKGVEYYDNKRTHQRLPLYYQLYLDYVQNQNRLNILQAIAGLKIPVLIQHGIEDEAVPFQHAEYLHQANPESKLLLYQSNHTFGRRHPYTHETLPSDCLQAIHDAIGFVKHYNFLNS